MIAPPHMTTPARVNARVVLAWIAGVAILVISLVAYERRSAMRSGRPQEARNNLALIAQHVSYAYSQEGKLCDSASAPVPKTLRHAGEDPFQTSYDEWNVDQPQNKGFACLNFNIAQPHYYQYDYRVTGDSFVVIARGNVPDDHSIDTYSIAGRVVDGHVELGGLLDYVPGE